MEPAPKKFKSVRITEDMTEEVVAEIMQERLDRKRANSRRWHAKYDSKGVPLISV